MARVSKGSTAARGLAARAWPTPLAPFFGLSLVLHGAALGWLAPRGSGADPVAPEPPRARFHLRLASVATRAADADAPPEDELRPRDVQLERRPRIEEARPPRRDSDNATLPSREADIPAARVAEAALGPVLHAEGDVSSEAATPPRQAVELLRDDVALQRFERNVRLESPGPLAPVAAAPSVDSSAAEGEAHPDPLHSPQPEYPRLARLRRWEGTCVLLARVGADGGLVELTVLESSGRRVLDEAALEGVRRWRFEPARLRGRAVESAARIPVTFQIKR